MKLIIIKDQKKVVDVFLVFPYVLVDEDIDIIDLLQVGIVYEDLKMDYYNYFLKVLQNMNTLKGKNLEVWCLIYKVDF